MLRTVRESSSNTAHVTPRASRCPEYLRPAPITPIRPPTASPSHLAAQVVPLFILPDLFPNSKSHRTRLRAFRPHFRLPLLSALLPSRPLFPLPFPFRSAAPSEFQLDAPPSPFRLKPN